MTGDAAVQWQCFSVAQKILSCFCAALSEGHDCGCDGQNIHGEKYRPAFNFCCFVGQAIHCIHAYMAPASC